MNRETNLQFHPASFRDPEGRVFLIGERVFRTLSTTARDRMLELEGDGRLRKLIDEGVLLPCRLTSASEAGKDVRECGEIIMEHEKIPILTYPYEWSFDMLRDAALTTLDLTISCLEKGLILKDATPFNIAFHKNRMVFIDTLSIDYYREGQPWEAYSQFCREFLLPLMLTAHKGIEFQPWLRGELNGLQISALSRVFGYFDAPFRGITTHIHLQAALEKYLAKKDVSLRRNFEKVRLSKPRLLKMLRGLRRTVETMKYRPNNSLWSNYERDNSYTLEDEALKERFVRDAGTMLGSARWVDIGSNSGKYSECLSSTAKSVVGLEADPSAINAYYKRFRGVLEPFFIRWSAT